ncbi:MAG: tRNA (guanosine(46)-N7)-methyltransferase TrmB [Chthoniobacterales bacterium]|nr:tRNA (guanosine(46)-N7)-methyltransferase TrmB [Chthoniobacterales bacterium]
MRTNTRSFLGAEVELESVLVPLDLVSVFGRLAPVEVDFGSGDGSFLVALAERSPERDFLGVEKLPGRFQSGCRRIGARGLSNARILQLEISHALYLLPRGSIDVFYLLFPDPWPKRRHQLRRVVTTEFLRAVARALKSHGAVRIKTDQEDYFAAMQRTLRDAPELNAIVEDGEAALPQTTFEKRFLQAGAPIYRLELRKTVANG